MTKTITKLFFTPLKKLWKGIPCILHFRSIDKWNSGIPPVPRSREWPSLLAKSIYLISLLITNYIFQCFWSDLKMPLPKIWPYYCIWYEQLICSHDWQLLFPFEFVWKGEEVTRTYPILVIRTTLAFAERIKNIYVFSSLLKLASPN